MLKKLYIGLLFAICMNVGTHQLNGLLPPSDAGAMLEYCEGLFKSGHSPEEVQGYLKSLLQETAQTGSVRAFYRPKKLKRNDGVISFAAGACAGLALVAGGLGAFYLYACSQDAQDKKEKTDIQTYPPNNFHQKNNWCWMVSVLQGLYKLDTFKAWVNQKAAEDDSVLISPHEKDKIALARLLDNCFETMAMCAKSNNKEDIKKQVACAESIYDKLFDIQKKYEKHKSIAPDQRYAFNSGSKFCDELLTFFGENEADFPCGADGKSKPEWGPVVPIKRFYFQQQYSYGPADNAVLHRFDGFEREKLLSKDKKELIKLCSIQTHPILCFGMEDANEEDGVKQAIAIDGKEYELKAIVMWGPGHIVADADHGKWYIFDSMKKQRVQLNDAQMKKIYAGKGYEQYIPQVLCYEQK